MLFTLADFRDRFGDLVFMLMDFSAPFGSLMLTISTWMFTVFV